ncbi:MAG TPA: DUF1194 domain-containing protein [Bauldia sp.]|nr:DUF1194 domain-containing protein [Bauldia sp.]
MFLQGLFNLKPASLLLALAALVINAHAAPGDLVPAGKRPLAVDLALVLAIDVSASISAEEHRLQIEGYAQAFRDPAIVEAIANGERASIAVTVLEWANTEVPLQPVGWTLIDGAKSARSFASAVEALPYRPLKGTSIGSAIAFSQRLLESAPCPSERRIIDISGDGISMRESYLASARRAALADGITINGLPIVRSPADGLPDYYRRWVIGGPASFLVVADGFAAFQTAVREKLVLEIAGGAPRTRLSEK